MAKRKLLGGSLGLVAIGYVAGFLTAPRSGKRTRQKLKNNSEPLVDLEKDLKDVYSQTRKALTKLAEDEPKLTENLKKLKDQAMSSQGRVKDLLSAMHGYEDVDGDLNQALKEAKESLNSLKRYLSK